MADIVKQGIVETDKKKCTYRFRNACFTSYTDKIEYEDKLVKAIIYQREICPETQKEHWQGYVEFVKAITIKRMKKCFNNEGLHVEKRKGTQKQAIDYCKKDESRKDGCLPIVEGHFNKQGERSDIIDFVDHIQNHGLKNAIKKMPHMYVKFHKGFDKLNDFYTKEMEQKELQKEFKNCVLYKWQAKALEMLQNQNDRNILWIYDNVGNSGKSILCIYLVAMFNAFYCGNGKNADIAHAYQNQKLICFDYTRSQSDTLNYSILERLKTGIVFSPKYTSCFKVSLHNKIICVANFLPQNDGSEMSMDRFNIYEIQKSTKNDNNHVLKKYVEVPHIDED